VVKYNTTFQTEGYKDWSSALRIGRGFDRHAKSEQHIKNMENWSKYERSTSIDVQLSLERKRQVEIGNQDRQQRREILPLLLDITNTLARLKLPFRGHNESVSSSNRGVFLEISSLVARWNKELADHLSKSSQNAKGYPSYTSPSSQNEMIETIAHLIKADIADEVKMSKFYSICLDTTKDLSKNDQLSFVVRYVSPSGEIIEALLDMEHVKEANASGLFETLTSILNKHGLSIKNIRGQGYDGCSTMRGQYTGLQARVKSASPTAYFVHCYAHRLNLVIIDVCSENVMSRNFFCIIQKLYSFIESSAKRHGLFQDIIRDNSGVTGCHTLRSLSTTRWSSRADNCAVIMETLPAIIYTLEKITVDSSYDRDTAADAFSLSKSIDFDFCLCLVGLNDILQLCNVVSKSLQKEDLDISVATTQVEALIKEIEEARNEKAFEDIWNKAESMADGIGVVYLEPRVRKISKRIDENWTTQVNLSNKDRIRVEFYYGTIDLVLSALRSRFSEEALPLLFSIGCLASPSVTQLEKVKALSLYYPGDFDIAAIIPEYKLFCQTTFEKKDIHSIYLYMVDRGLTTVYPNLATLYQLVLTLPVTSCSCERSFSALKLVKSHLRTVMSQHRLSDLMVMSCATNCKFKKLLFTRLCVTVLCVSSR
jgi:hypothetical protein